jgi:hypothetical protein
MYPRRTEVVDRRNVLTVIEKEQGQIRLFYKAKVVSVERRIWSHRIVKMTEPPIVV